VGGEVRGNYCTWNAVNKSANTTLSNGNLNATSAVADWRAVLGTIGMTSGKWYWEQTITGSALNMHGIAKQGVSLESFIGVDANGWGYYGNSGTYNNSNLINTSTFASYTGGDIIGIAFDADNGSLYFYKNGTVQNSGSPAYTGLTSGPYFPAASHFNSSSSDVNFGQRAFAYQTPGTNRPAATYKALCTQNLPAPLVTKSNTVMDVVTYTGNGSTQSITGLGFSPDFAWFKRRDSANNHALFDIVRGSGKFLISNETGGEGTDSNSLISFDTSGFTIGQSVSAPSFNISSGSYVAWSWDAGTSTVSNTQGSITSQVRANATAGFSIVKFTPGGAGQVTIGHGLGASPGFIIIKTTNLAANWYQWITSLTVNEYLTFTTAAKATSANFWGTSLPSSTVFGYNAGGAFDHIAYCFAPVVGYSSFGSYTGNGSTDGPFVYTGMRPRWILVRSTSGARDWLIYDTARGVYNENVEGPLQPNTSGTAYNNIYLPFDILSNGFKPRAATTNFNASGEIHIYAAFAEAPFNYSRAR
jgi:hypothetical protein